MRRIVATVAGFGFVAGFCIFVSSFVGATIEKLWPLFFLLHVGILALLIPIVVFDRSAGERNGMSWMDLKQRTPEWAIFGTKLLALLFGIIFVLFLSLSHAASPEIQNGNYVLNSHGKIVALLTQTEYLALKGWELRFFASGWMFAYFYLSVYWWFTGNRQQGG